MSKSIHQRVVSCVGTIALLVTLSGGVSIWSSRHQAAALDRMNHAAELLRNHMDADMMHDAIRADALSIVLAAKNGSDMAEARKDLGEHSALLTTNVAEDAAYLGSPAVTTATAGIKKKVDAYVGAANALADAAQSDPATAEAQFPAFLAQFRELETGMSAVSDAIEGHVTEVKSGAERASTIATLLIVGSTLASLLVIGVIFMMCRRVIIEPLTGLVGVIRRMSTGDLSVAVPSTERADELGQLAEAMLAFRDQLHAAEQSKADQADMLVDSVGEGLARLAKGDLISRIDADLSGPFARLKTDFNQALEALQDTLSSVSSTTGRINGGANEIRQSSDDLARRTEQQAANLEETAAAMNQLTSSVADTASEAGRASTLVAQVRDSAEHGGNVVRRAVNAMGGIERASEEIAAIIGVIDGIAFQTNLLALNAGVEAARAGDAGKGFAVVASEVRALAQRSADAARDVKTRVLASREQVGSGVALVNETGEALEAIIGQIGEINDRVSAIAGAAQRQSTGIQQINGAVREMDTMTQQNAAMVEQATAAARNLSDGADDLADQVARFKTGKEAGWGRSAAVPHRAPSSAPRPAPAYRSAGNAALAVDEEAWQEF